MFSGQNLNKLNFQLLELHFPESTMSYKEKTTPPVKKRIHPHLIKMVNKPFYYYFEEILLWNPLSADTD